MPVNHKRFDAVLTWAPQLGVRKTCAAEFEALRRIDKLSGVQMRRVQHLERHLDAGEFNCDCYETLRPL